MPGRVSFLEVNAAAALEIRTPSEENVITLQAAVSNGAFAVRASVVLPPRFGAPATAPPGGLRLRLRPPAEHAGKMASVTVGGKPWAAFDPQAETVNFEAKLMTPSLVQALQRVEVTWA